MGHKYYQCCRSVNVRQGCYACSVVNVVTMLLCLCAVNVNVDKYGCLDLVSCLNPNLLLFLATFVGNSLGIIWFKPRSESRVDFWITCSPDTCIFYMQTRRKGLELTQRFCIYIWITHDTLWQLSAFFDLKFW